MGCMRACLPVIAALALAGCGGSSATSASSTQTSSTATSSATSTAASTTSTTTSSPTTTVTAPTTTASGPALCRAAGLAPTYLGQQGATGHGEIGFALRNTGSSPCSSFGFPGVLFLDRSGAPLPTASTRTTHDLFGSTPAVALVLAPGASASFRLGVTHGISSSAGCTTAYGLQVIPPNDTSSLRISIPDGAYECGTATVSPLRPGDSAYP
jgi:hypothetical protein